jgi:hypothetical protein
LGPYGRVFAKRPSFEIIKQLSCNLLIPLQVIVELACLSLVSIYRDHTLGVPAITPDLAGVPTNGRTNRP